jgi:DNA-binding LacI/PurR family transcriptional regulator
VNFVVLQERFVPTASPKHREVESVLRREIEAGVWLPGERIPAEHELSNRFGVAYMTARQAVGTLVNDRILQRIPGKGTFVLSSEIAEPTTRLTSPLVLLVPALWQRLDPYYFPDVLAGFESEMEKAGHKAAIHDYVAAEQEGRLSSDTIVACLLIGKEETELIERVRDRGCRVLAINRYMGRRAIPAIAPDNAGGVAKAVRHLTDLGHTRIGFVRGVSGNLDATDRRRGFRTEMRLQDLSPDTEAGEGFREEFGYRAAQELLNRTGPPTALVCASDLSAMGVLKAAQEKGLRVPEDLSLVGFGDFSVAAYLHPGLTTVCLPRWELGETAARSLIKLASGQELKGEVLETHLVKRGTTAPPPV